MITTGNKFLVGATVATTVAAILYGLTQGGVVPTLGLVFAAIAFGILAAANLVLRDANVAPDSDAEAATAARRPPGSTARKHTPAIRVRPAANPCSPVRRSAPA